MTNKTTTAKFTINSKTLLTELNLQKLIVSKKSTIPVLTAIKIELVGPELTITGTDLETTFISSLTANKTESDGAFCVDLHRLIDCIGKATGELQFEAIETNHGKNEKTDSDRITVELILKTSSSNSVLECWHTENFPMIEQPEKLITFAKIQENIYKDLIAKTTFAVTTEQSRFTLAVFALEPGKKGIRAITTNGHCLALAESFDFEQVTTENQEIHGSEYPTDKDNYLFRIDAAKLLQKAIVDRAEFSANDEYICVSTKWNERRIYARIPSGQFPNYEMVLPKRDKAFTLQLHPVEVLSVTKDALKLADERTHSIAFQPYYNNFVIKSGDSEKKFTGKATCDFPQNSAPAVLINGKYFADALQAAENQTLEIAYTDGKSQFGITGNSDFTKFEFVIMPLKDGETPTDANFQILSDEEKAELKLIPFYKDAQKKAKVSVKSDQSKTIAEIESLLSEMQSLTAVDGMPEMFTEIANQICENIGKKLKSL